MFISGPPNIVSDMKSVQDGCKICFCQIFCYSDSIKMKNEDQ